MSAWISGIRLGPRQVRIELGEHDLRHRQAQRPRDLPGDQLRDQRPRALAGAAELQHVHPVVVRLDDGGQRAAFAKRRDIAGDGDRPERTRGRIVAHRSAVLVGRSRHCAKVGASQPLMIDRLMARAGLVTPEQRAWAWYDWANSAYFTTVITAVFPSFYASYAAAGLEPADATARFGAITTISVAVVALTAPVLGALADYSGIKKRLLASFMAIGVTSCAAMALIGEGDIGLASTLFFVGNIGVSGSLVFYDSLLPHVAKAEETDRVSAAGYAIGYVGGGLLLLVNLAWILQAAVVRVRLHHGRGEGLVPVGGGVVGSLLAAALPRQVSEPPTRLDAERRARGIGCESRVRSAGPHLR